MINIGKYIEMYINWLKENFAGLFDVIKHLSLIHISEPTRQAEIS